MDTRLNLLVKVCPELTNDKNIKRCLNKNNIITKEDIYKILAELVIEPKYTYHIIRIFKTVLPPLISFLLENVSSSYINNLQQSNKDTLQETHDKITTALSKMLPLYPQSLTFILRHFENSPPLLDRILSEVDKEEEGDVEMDSEDETSDKKLELIKTAFRLLSFAPKEFVHRWNWSPFFTLLKHKNDKVKWYASRCVSILLSCENFDDTLTNSTFSQVEKLDKEMKEMENLFFENSLLFHDSDEKEKETEPVTYENAMVNVCGVWVHSKKRQETIPESKVVYSDTTIENMRALAMAVSQGSGILLEGVTGSGKTMLVEELARLTGNTDMIKVNMDESFDSKDLIGTYVCTDVPGEFKWQPGALTKAVMEGRWILIEDVDLASFDVISSLIPLIESNELFIPSRCEVIRPADGFKLFGTQGLLETFSGVPRRQRAIPMLSLWKRVAVKMLPITEIQTVLEKRYSTITKLIPKFIETYEALRGKVPVTDYTEEKEDEKKEFIQVKSFGRYFSLRDLLKWCERVEKLHRFKIKGDFLSSSITDEIYHEAVDCFCGMITKQQIYDQTIKTIANVWKVPSDRLSYFADYYKPQLVEESGNITIGRSVLERDASSLDKKLKQRSTFAHTKHTLRLMEKIAVCVSMNEPVLLTGETGTGKTTIVQYLANLLGRKLIVHNLNQQTDSADFIGGFKPVDLRILAAALKNNFHKLFSVTFSLKANKSLFQQIEKLYAENNWSVLVSVYRKIVQKANEKLENLEMDEHKQQVKVKKSKLERNLLLKKYWKGFEDALNKFSRQQLLVKNSFAFSFVEGSLVKALKEGHWILLDEINLASTETLERLSGLLEGKDGTLSITEKGETEPIKRHPNFRLFACMNPPTDIGKKNLPPSLRTRFTEFYVKEMTDPEDLKIIVQRYLESSFSHPPTEDIVNFYLEARRQAEANLSDGANQKPSYSLRTLSRALEYTSLVLNMYGAERSLYEGFCMSFLTQLNRTSYPIIEELIRKYMLKTTSIKALKGVPKKPGDDYTQFEHFWIKKGPYPIEEQPQFILTPSVVDNLKNIARAIIAQRYPILLQGPTSAGKTSMIKYLAKMTGHRFVRINNHETTDLQEYFGTYITNKEGKLVFKEGILVEAVRNGYWIVLDELNLAPSEILEGLNRLLDDNRELFIAETQETVKPHPHFQLFATQNPPGIYGGRKVLSRAFRNRFLEIQVDDIPGDELQTILARRCKIPQTFAKKMVAVMKELQGRRQSSKVFAGKGGFITPRDLFRWAERMPDSNRRLAEIGYMLLAERLRKPEEKLIVKEALEKHILNLETRMKKVELDIDEMYNVERESHELHQEFKKVQQLFQSDSYNFTKMVWTKSMKRLFTLIGNCLKHKEPVLLVGETGCGKTTVCQLYSYILEKQLQILNCHQHTETSDFLGSLRPVRGRDQLLANIKQLIKKFIIEANKLGKKVTAPEDLSECVKHFEQICKQLAKERKERKKKLKLTTILNIFKEIQEKYKESKALFHWYDGPLVQAMKEGNLFLIDEISLAEDAVLERLNSVLEPERTLTIPEKGTTDEIVALDSFRIMATMNPGGDFGKRELSPALRNRFTEIYVPPLSVSDDLTVIIADKLVRKEFTSKIIDFVTFFKSLKTKRVISIRDVVSWLEFMNTAITKLNMEENEAYLHGAEVVFLDGLGVGVDTSVESRESLKTTCFNFLLNQVPEELRASLQSKFEDQIYKVDHLESAKSDKFGFAPFFVEKGPLKIPESLSYSLSAPTTGKNVMKVLRAMQLPKPLLLEGSPGVGKTSLIQAIAKASGHEIVRINLSEQTDMMDILGSDLPVEGSSGGEFQWSDGIFLRALKSGHWVLLDELNLASQSVLEGLNSVLDHRTEIFIPELNKTFTCPKSFRIFVSQNPYQQGGGRKGLPKSFLNRFTKVYVDELKTDDLLFITNALHGEIGEETLKKMIEFNQRMYEETMIKRSFGRKGSPWEFNLRDVFRWCEMMKKDNELYKIGYRPEMYIDAIYRQRMRTVEDRKHVLDLYEQVFNKRYEVNENPHYVIGPNYVQIGTSFLEKGKAITTKYENLSLLQSFLNPLENVMKCVQMNFMTIITGPSACGKTSLIRLLAQMTGHVLHEFAMNSSTDTVELLGGFEQVDPLHKITDIINLLKSELAQIAKACVQKNSNLDTIKQIYNDWSLYKTSAKNGNSTTEHELHKIELIKTIAKKTYRLAEEMNLTTSSNLEEIKAKLKGFSKLIKDGVKGRFEWNDGLLIRALESGEWVLIDNVNFCNPTVLDRLNSLLEPGGVLVVNERGMVDGEVKIVAPHPDFRIFMVMDPKYGEISRAMRNRGIEISMMNIPIPSQDGATLLSNIGIPSKQISELLMKYHDSFIRELHLNEDDRPTIRDLLRCGEILCSEIKQGLSPIEALKKALTNVYIRNRIMQEMDQIAAQKLLDDLLANKDEIASNFFPSMTLLNSCFKTKKYLLTMIMRYGGCLYDSSQQIMVQSLIEKIKNTKNEEEIKKILDGVEWKNVIGNLPEPVLQYIYGNIDKLPNMEESVNPEKLYKQFQYSAEYFVDMTSPETRQFAILWLQRLANKVKKEPMIEQIVNKSIYILDKIVNHVVYKHILDNRKRICTSMKDILYQPINLNMNKSANCQLSNLLNEDAALYDKFRILLDRLNREFDEKSYYEKMKATPIQQDSSLMHQSYFYFSNPNQRSRLSDSHKIVVYFYPLFQAIDAFMNSLLHPSMSFPIKNIENLILYRDRLWSYLTKNIVLEEEILIYFKWLQKSLKFDIQNREYQQVTHIMNDISKFLNLIFKNIHELNTLWVNEGKPEVIKSGSLLQTKTEIEEFDANYKGGNPEINSLVMKGISTILWLNMQGEETEEVKELEKSLSELPKVLQTKSLSIKEKKAEQEQILEEIFESLKQYEEKEDEEEAMQEKSNSLFALFDHKSMVKEMELLALLSEAIYTKGGNKEAIIVQCKELVDFVTSKCSRSPLDVVPYQILLWKIQTCKDNEYHSLLSMIVQDALYRWHMRIWNNSFNTLGLDDESVSSNYKLLDGATRLFQDVKAIKVIPLLQEWKNVPIRLRFTKIEEMKKIVDYLATSEHLPSPIEADWKQITFNFANTIICYKNTFTPEIFNEIISIINSIIQHVLNKNIIEGKNDILSNLKKLLMKSIDERLKRASDEIIKIAKILLKRHEKEYTEQEDISILGEAWTYFGMCRLNLIMIAQALDPTRKYSVQLMHTKTDLETVKEKEALYRQIEKFITGGTTNHIIEQLQLKSTILEKIFNKMERKQVPRPTDISFKDLYYDMREFIASLIEEGKVSSLVNMTKSGNVSSDEGVLVKEDLWQSTTSQFVHKVQTKYKGYEDIILPFIVCIFQIKYGLRLLCYGSFPKSKEETELHHMIHELLAFPSSNQAAKIEKLIDLVNSMSVQSDRFGKYEQMEILVKVLKVVIQKCHLHVQHVGKLNSRQAKLLDLVFSTFTKLYTTLQDEITKQKLEKESLIKYKERTIEIETDEQLLEKEIARMFPNYADTYIDLLDDTSRIKSTTKESNEQLLEAKRALQQIDDLYEIFKTHQQIYTSQQVNLRDMRNKVFDKSFAIARDFMGKTEKQYTFQGNDNLSLLYFGSTNLAKLSEKFKKEMDEMKIMNIYEGENVAEVGKALSVLSQFVIKVQKVLDKFQENPMLIHLLKVAQRVLELPITSPVIKVLTGLELLLEKATEWEKYKTSEVGSIKDEIKKLTVLILRWRKMELENWRSIFVNKKKEFIGECLQWWFKFYKIINMSIYDEDVMNKKEGEEELSVFESFLRAIDEFIRTSYFGDFTIRLEMVKSFGDQILKEESLFERKNMPIEVRKKFANIIYNVYKFYAQFIPKMEETIQKQVKPLEEKLLEFIKLMKWEDASFEILNSSTQKSHRKLGKFSSGYSKILRQPARDIWDKSSPFEQIEVKLTKKERQKLYKLKKEKEKLDNEIPLVNLMKKYKQSSLNLDKIISKMVDIKETKMNKIILEEERIKSLRSLVERMNKIADKHILDGSSVKLCEFSVNYLEDLSETVITRSQELRRKGTTMAKQRALVTLLTELKEIGTSYLVKPIEHLIKSQNLFEQEQVQLNYDIKELQDKWNEGDAYYFKNLYLLQKLRFASQDVHMNVKNESQRMIGYAENVFVEIMKQRNLLLGMQREHDKLVKMIDTFDLFEGKKKSPIGYIPPQKEVAYWIEKQKESIDSLLELSKQWFMIYESVKSTKDSKQELLKFSKIIEKMEVCKNVLDAIYVKEFQIWRGEHVEIVKQNYETVTQVLTEFEQMLPSCGIPNHCTELHELIGEYKKDAAKFSNLYNAWSENKKTKSDESFIKQFREHYDNIILRTQFTIQNLKKHSESMKMEDDPKMGMYQKVKKYFEDLKTIQLPELNSRLQRIVKLVTDYTNQNEYSPKKEILSTIAPFLQNLVPMIRYVSTFIQLYQYQFLYYHKSLSKFGYVLLNVFTSLFKEGFCIQEEETEGESKEGELDFNEGTGMDEGEGTKDVSDQIENEDQLLNEKDTMPPEEKQINNDSEGIEMEQDFEGTLEDVERDEEDDDDERDEEEEMENETGDVDNENEELLDQRLWNEEDKRDDREQKMDGPQNVPAPEQQQDLKAKEEESNEDEKKEKREEEETKIEWKEEEYKEDPDQEEFRDDFKDHQMDEEKQNDLFLPENMELDVDDDEENEEEMDEGHEEEKPKEEETIELPKPQQAEPENIENIETEDIKQDEGEDEKEQQEEEDEEMADEEETKKGLDASESEVPKGEGEEEMKDEEMDETKPPQEEEEFSNLTKEEETFQQDKRETPFGVNETMGKPSEIKDEVDNEQEAEEKQLNPEEGLQGKDMNREEFGDSHQQGDNNEDKNEEPKGSQVQFDPNPFRNLGDALKEWKEKIKLIEEQSKKEKEQQIEKDTNADEYEFMQNEEEKSEEQTVGPATEEQASKFPNLEMEEENDLPDEEENLGKKDFTNETEEEEGKTSTKDGKTRPKETEDKNDDDEMEIEKMEEEEEEEYDLLKENEDKKDEEQMQQESTLHMKDLIQEDVIQDENNNMSMEDVKKMQDEMEKNYQIWRQKNENVERGKLLFKQFDQQTHSLAQELCEQLRLILEPTLATKMKGDYKTGKRINMKKVIPYIASSFRKDKIWLRRTKPNKRQYQVLVAIDDSKSMAKNDAGKMACAALTLLCKAMSQLEVGQLAVVSFGESMKLLHPFDKPFTDESASEILGQFTFDQGQTQMTNFLTQAIQLLDLYKGMTSLKSATEQVQLTFIISDGRILERESVVMKVREAQQKKQLMVFILIDNPNPKDSVLELKTVSYPQGKLTIKSYMDEFPFPYYIILRDIGSLPEILADALRQWFELMQNIQE